MRHMIRVTRRHDLTNKKTNTKTNKMKKTKTMTIEEHPQSHEELFCNIVDAVGVFKRQIKKVIPLQ